MIGILQADGFAVDSVRPEALGSNPRLLEDYDVVVVDDVAARDIGVSPHISPKGPEKAALSGIKRLSRTFHKPNKGGPYDDRV